MTGFRTFLLPEHLSFVAPPEGDPAHPDRVLHAVTERAGKGGIIIVGAGGVGKTRTSLAIAIRAERQGWRVLHVLPGEPGATVEDLAQIMFPGDRATLVVFDYLDQMQRLDMGALRHRLIPEAGARGMRLALLANARPGGLRLRNDERDAVFARVELNPAETQRHQISVRVQQQVAPMASAILGAARVQILCGERPIIAMFIARELERRAQEGTLDEPSLAGLRAGELSGWLRRRLAEDRLLAPDSGAFLPPTPEPSVVAAATALAVAPLPLNVMTAAVALTLEAAEPTGRVQADRVIRMLLALGWLEQRDHDLAAAHDVVADEVLEQALWEQPGDGVRTLVFDQVLSAPLQFARCLGRLAVTLSRLLGPTPSSQAFKGALQAAAVAWLATHAEALGRALAEGDPDEVSFALGAALSGPPWSDACVEQWDALVAPWLTRHGGLWEARHLFYRGLKFLPANSAGELTGVAFGWLGIHIQQRDANFVLGPLLAREDLGPHAPTAIARAMAWLESHGKALEAQFVFNPLLAREDLGEHAPTAIARAMAWLSRTPAL